MSVPFGDSELVAVLTVVVAAYFGRTGRKTGVLVWGSTAMAILAAALMSEGQLVNRLLAAGAALLLGLLLWRTAGIPAVTVKLWIAVCAWLGVVGLAVLPLALLLALAKGGIRGLVQNGRIFASIASEMALGRAATGPQVLRGKSGSLSLALPMVLGTCMAVLPRWLP